MIGEVKKKDCKTECEFLITLSTGKKWNNATREDCISCLETQLGAALAEIDEFKEWQKKDGEFHHEEIEKLNQRIHNQAERMKQDPVMVLSAIAGICKEPMECGHHVDCLDDETSECGYCAALAEIERFKEADRKRERTCYMCDQRNICNIMYKTSAPCCARFVEKTGIGKAEDNDEDSGAPKASFQRG